MHVGFYKKKYSNTNFNNLSRIFPICLESCVVCFILNGRKNVEQTRVSIRKLK